MEINGQTFVLKIFRRFIAAFGQFGAGFLYRKSLPFRESGLLDAGGVLIAEKKEEILPQPFFLSVPKNGLRVFQRGPAVAIHLQTAPFFKRRIRQLFVGFHQYAYPYPVHAVVSQLSQTFPLGLTAPHCFPEISTTVPPGILPPLKISQSALTTRSAGSKPMEELADEDEASAEDTV